MCNPFGWQPSLLAYDLSSGSQWGSMNIHMNQAWADMQARSTLYMTPTMGFGNFIEYGMPNGGLNFLCDPGYTIGQWQWNQNNMGGCGFGNFDMNGMNWGNNPWGNFGWQGGNSSGSNPSAATPEERAAQRKYNKLLALVKQLASDDSKLPAARKEALDEIAKHPVGKTYKEKLESLKAEYNRVSKEDIKKFLTSNAAKSFTTDGSTNNANSFYNKLQKVGFEFENSAVDSEVSGLYDVISQIKDTQENYQNNNILADLAAKTGTYDILDVISSWNTQKKDSTGEEKRIITLIKKGYDALPSGETGNGARSSVKTGVISPIVNGLIDRARGLKSGLDSASQTKLTEAMTKLERAYNNTDATVDPNLSTAFDELYVLTRKAAIAQLRAEIKEAYGTIDPDLFNDTLFEAETIADLKAEGFNEAVINAANIVVAASNDSGIYTQRVDETKPAREQLEAITGTDNALSKATSVSGIAGVTEAWIDNNTGKVYVLKQNADGEDEIHELNNPTVDNGKVTAGTVGAKVNANDIALASATAKQEAQALKTEQDAVTALVAKTDIIKETGATISGEKIYTEQKGDKRQFVLVNGVLYEYKNGTKGNKVSASSIESAYNSAIAPKAEYDISKEKTIEAQEMGRKMQDCLHGYTTEDNWFEFNGYLSKINSTNVMQMLRGYRYESCEDSWFWNSERFFQQLLTENGQETYKKNAAKKVIHSVITYIDDNIGKITSADDQKRIEEIRSNLKEFEFPDNEQNKKGKELDNQIDELFLFFDIEYKKEN